MRDFAKGIGKGKGNGNGKGKGKGQGKGKGKRIWLIGEESGAVRPCPSFFTSGFEMTPMVTSG
jgi:hypothetical protein